MKNRIIETFKEMGLESKEIRVYLALLQIGSSTASVLSNKTDIPRSTTRHICDTLVQKGFFRKVQKNNTYVYTAEPPNKLFVILDDKKKKVERTKDRLSDIMSSLEHLRNPFSVAPKVQFYEGVKGKLQAYDELIDQLKHNDEILVYVDPYERKNDKEGIFDDLYKLVRARKEKNIKARMIAIYSETSAQLKKDDSENLRETLLIHPKGDRIGTGETIIYQDLVYYIWTDFDGQMFSASIKSPFIAQFNRMLFATAWEEAKKEDREICKQLKI